MLSTDKIPVVHRGKMGLKRADSGRQVKNFHLGRRKDGVEVDVAVKFEFSMLGSLSPDQIRAVLEGIGKVIAAQNGRENGPKNHPRIYR